VLADVRARALVEDGQQVDRHRAARLKHGMAGSAAPRPEMAARCAVGQYALQHRWDRPAAARAARERRKGADVELGVIRQSKRFI
jgi:hypothetical protein